MADSTETRTYISPKREEQAKATRRAILDASRRLFLRDGYGATSIRAIAEEAGVAVQTVYAVFGNKRQLVIELSELAVKGDDEREPVTQQAEVEAIRAEPSPHRRAELDAALSRKIIERFLPLFKITSDAAAVDPEFAELNRAMIERRRAEMPEAATLLAGDDGLRVSPEDAAVSLFVLYSPARRPNSSSSTPAGRSTATRNGSRTPSSDSSSTTDAGCPQRWRPFAAYSRQKGLTVRRSRRLRQRPDLDNSLSNSARGSRDDVHRLLKTVGLDHREAGNGQRRSHERAVLGLDTRAVVVADLHRRHRPCPSPCPC